MTSALPRKFAIDLELSHEGRVVRAGETMKTRFTRDDVDQAFQRGLEEGRASAEAQAARAAQTACEHILQRLQPVAPLLDRHGEALRQDAARLALAIGHALSGTALRHYGEDSLMAAIEDAMSAMRNEPRVIIRVPPAFLPALEARLVPLITDMGFAERVMLRGDPKAAPGDWAIEWREGEIAFSTEAMSARIEELLQSGLAQTDPLSTHSPE